MRRLERDGISWLEFEQLANFPKLRHGVFLRHGGASEGTFSSLNLSDNRGDRLENVLQNQKSVKKILGVNDLAWARQCHGVSLQEVTADNVAHYANADAMATEIRGIGLMIMHADCQAAIFYDPVRHVLANTHAGWRGSVQNIYLETIEFMKKRYGSDPADLLVCISPSLGPEAAEFLNYRLELPENFWRFQVKENHFDFWEISRWQLVEAGVLDGHIEIAQICTKKHPEDYFSHRYDHQTGRHGTVAVLL